MYKLTSISENDKEFIKKGLSDPLVYKYYGVRLTDENQVHAQMKWYHELVENRTGQWWIISSLDNNEKIGAIGISDADPVKQNAELGFWIIPEFWGGRIISIILPDFFKSIKHNWPLKQLVAYVESENEKSEKVLLRNGFRFIGVLPKAEFKDDKWIDLDIYQLDL